MNIFLQAGWMTIQIFVSLFGLLIIIGYLLAMLNKKIQSIYHDTFGWYGILWTAWIGTPIHEISHLFFIQLFRHKVTHISLFEPNKQTGGLGYVDHSYNPKNIYHQMGNFFIGVAPLIVGSLILSAVIYTGFDNGPDIIERTYTSHYTPISIFQSGVHSITNMFDIDTHRPWYEYLVLYAVIAISSHIIPSKKDIINALRGLPFVCGVLFITVLILSIFSIPIALLTQIIQMGTTILAQLQLFIGLLLLTHLIIIFGVTLPIRILRRRVA